MFPVVEIGPLTFFTHDIFTLLGLAAGFALYYRALRRDRILGPQIVVISLAALAGGAIGARLLTSWEVIDEVQAGESADDLRRDPRAAQHHRRPGRRLRWRSS